MSRTQVNLFLLAFISLACFFLVWNMHRYRYQPTQPIVNQHHDTYLHQATLRTIDATGNLQHKLRAATVRHYPQQNRTELELPKLDIYDQKGDHWIITARHATSLEGSTEITLRDHVQIVKDANFDTGEVVIRTSKLIVHPAAGTADSAEQVSITYPQFSVNGRGLHSDLNRGTFTLLAKIGASYDPQTAAANHTDTLR
ncbi:MAG: LPS export ABC transporter periplasmic protein LptC [Pseudomonadota bacterium]|nr:LPS export ABC transporter periplasmic protein LptC [Pseudomonadota bacterium]